MSPEHDALELLEDLNARILATDPADSGRVAQLRSCLEDAVRSLDPAAIPTDLLKLGLPALRSVEETSRPDAPQVLNSVASAISAVVQHVAGEAEQNAAVLADAARSLQAFSAGDENTTPASAPTPNDTGDARPPAMGSAQSAPIVLPDDFDVDLVKEFIAESVDRLTDAETLLLELETAPDNAEHINAVLRAFHTVKGASGFLGLDQVQKLAHLAESLLTRARDGEIQITGAYADLALRSCDMLKAMVEGLNGAQAGQTLTLPNGLGELLSFLSTGDTPTAPAPASVDAAPADDVPPPETPQCEQEPVARSSDAGLMGAESTVRVGTERLDDLVNMVGELVIAHSQVAQDPHVTGEGGAQLAGCVAQAGKIIRELQELTMSLRMVPLKGTFQRMTRLVRDLAHKSGKSVHFVTHGEETEIDRNTVEVLNDPLVHLIRNAVDHGIESVDDRVYNGKNTTGTLSLRAYHAAGSVVIEITDDGRGLDRDGILAKAAALGLVKAGDDTPDAEAYSLIFHPGLSTAKKVTDVSGRGVGMDIVKKSVDALRGRIDVRSTPGHGTTFTLRVPLTMAIVDTMLVRVGAERYLLPMVSIERSFRPTAGSVSTVAGRGEMVALQDGLLPVFRLSRLFDVPGSVSEPTDALLIAIEGQGKRCALMVDELLGQQQAVVKSLGQTFAGVRGVSAGAILGDGRVGLILDAAGIIQLSQEAAPAA